jgi:hypothetical protein
MSLQKRFKKPAASVQEVNMDEFHLKNAGSILAASLAAQIKRPPKQVKKAIAAQVEAERIKNYIDRAAEARRQEIDKRRAEIAREKELAARQEI